MNPNNNNNNNALASKLNKIQNEILNIGWDGIMKKYHPDQNIHHADALKTFNMYKEIYENMKKRLLLNNYTKSN